MKKIIRRIALNTVVIFTAAFALPGLSFSNDLKVLFLAAAALVLVNLLVRPVVKLITLPVNFMTLGVFSWLVNVLMLYIVTQLISGFSVAEFAFEGFSFGGFSMPAMQVSIFWSYVLASLTIGLLSSFFDWVFD